MDKLRCSVFLRDRERKKFVVFIIKHQPTKSEVKVMARCVIFVPKYQSARKARRKKSKVTKAAQPRFGKFRSRLARGFFTAVCGAWAEAEEAAAVS